MKLVSIAAVAENGVIGGDGKIPWDYPADIQHYKETTTGHPIIMGRKTYESVGQPLPDRTNIVLTTTGVDAPASVLQASSVDKALVAARECDAETAYVIGGEGVYEAFMPHVDELLLTHIPGEYEGDTYFPDWNDNDWTVIDRQSLTDELEVVRYEP